MYMLKSQRKKTKFTLKETRFLLSHNSFCVFPVIPKKEFSPKLAFIFPQNFTYHDVNFLK